MLEKLRVKNFRLLRDVEIDFTSKNNVPIVFIGPNASGKSTILEVLDFLSRCATDGLQAAVAAHGGAASMRTAGSANNIEIEMLWRVEQLELHDLRWNIAFGVAQNGSVFVRSESLSTASNDALIVTDTKSGIRIVLDEKEQTGSTVKSSLRLAFEEFVDNERFDALGTLKGLLEFARILGALAVAPPWIRGEVAQSSPRDSMVIGPKAYLDRQGLGLANVLYGINTDHADAWSDIERAFKTEFPFVRRIVFPADVGGSKISFAIDDHRFSRKLYASEMSDGMIAYLCLLAAVLHPEQYGVLGLDEPDASLHPSALRRLMSLAHDDSNARRRRLLIVTHSNELLDELQDPAESIRVVEAGKDGAVVRKLDPEALAAWRETYSLSEMRRTGLLDSSNAAQANDK
jgi:predicted ATPase